MAPNDFAELAGVLLGLYAFGFLAGYIVTAFKRFTEQI